MNSVVVSPHYDDAVLSCYPGIETGSQVVTLFTGVPLHDQPSGWDLATGFTSPQEAMAARRKENRAALQGTPSTPIDLGYLEHAYRQEMPDVDQIADDILRVGSKEAVYIVAAGVSNVLRGVHPDHVMTRHVGMRLMELGHTVLFYADIPYILPRIAYVNWPKYLQLRRSQIEKTLGTSVAIEPNELTETQRTRKRHALAAYASQLPLLEQGCRGALTKPNALRWEVIFRPVQQ